MKFVTFRLRLLLLIVLAASALASTALASAPPRYVFRYMAFVTMNGQGTVTSVPKGIACPRQCRSAWVRGTHLRLVAKPAAGWRLASFTSKWCKSADGVCAFDLVSPHDCVGGACPVGAFGVQVSFVRR